MPLAIATMITLLLLATTTYAFPLTAADKSAQAAQKHSLNNMIPSQWLNAASYSLLCYDALAAGVLCWLWLRGHLAWMKEGTRRGYGGERELGWAEQRRERQTLMEGEMMRLGMM